MAFQTQQQVSSASRPVLQPRQKAFRMMRDFLRNRFVLIALRWALAAVFIIAGCKKMGSPQAFADSIASFAILPNGLIALLALGLPPFEILAGLAIITGVQRRPALLGLALLTAVFMVVLGSAIARGLSIDCGCFGSGSPSPHEAWFALGRDVPILAVALFLYLVAMMRPRILQRSR